MQYTTHKCINDIHIQWSKETRPKTHYSLEVKKGMGQNLTDVALSLTSMNSKSVLCLTQTKERPQQTGYGQVNHRLMATMDRLRTSLNME